MIDEQTVNEMLLASEMIGFEKGRDAGRKAGLEEAATIVEDTSEEFKQRLYLPKGQQERIQEIISDAIRRRASEIGD